MKRFAVLALSAITCAAPLQAQEANPFTAITDGILAMPYFSADRAFDVLSEQGVSFSEDELRASAELDARIAQFDPTFTQTLTEGFRSRITAENLTVDAPHVAQKATASLQLEQRLVTSLLGVRGELMGLGMSQDEAGILTGGIAGLIDSHGAEGAKEVLYGADSPFSAEIADDIWRHLDGISDFQRLMLDHSIIVQ